MDEYKSISDELGVSKDDLYNVWKEFIHRKKNKFNNKENLNVVKQIYKGRPELLDYFIIVGLLSITELMKGEKNGL